MKTHKELSDGQILCGMVPEHSRKSSDWNNVDCKYCIKEKNKKVHFDFDDMRKAVRKYKGDAKGGKSVQ